jgi:succinoglycan biosynthesis transport protein ExoP
MSTVTRLPLPGSEPPHDGGIVFPGMAESGLDLRRMLGILKRRKMMIFGVMILFTSLVALYVSQLTPLYRAEASLVVEKNRQHISPVESVVQGISDDYLTSETEAAVIGSRELASKAVDRLNLVNNPLYNPALRPAQASLVGSVVSPVTDFINDRLIAPIKSMLFGQADKAAADAGDALSADDQRRALAQQVIDGFLGGLTVSASDRSRVILVDYASPDPHMAALAANTMAELYILDQLSTKGDATTRASEWLKQRVTEMATRVKEAEDKLAAFRQKSGIVDLGGSTTAYQQQLSRLDEELTTARNSLAEAQARYQQLQSNIESGNLDSSAAVLSSPLIQTLRSQEAEVARKLSDMRSQYREGHPQVKLAENALTDLKQKIQAEAQKLAANLYNELNIARVRVHNLEVEAGGLQQHLDKQSDAEVNVRALESEVKADKQLYETLLSRLRETNVQDDSSSQQADAKIISRATAPVGPYYPKTHLIVAAALVVSGVLGVGLALVLELLDTGFRSLQQIEQATGLSTLGMVPALSDSERRGKRPHEIAVDKPNSAFGEAIRTLRTGLLLTRIDHPPRSIMVTSSIPGEGKTSVALSLACSAARSAQKAMVIDCDLRHSNLHVYLGQPNKTGLTDYLAGQATLEDVVEIDPRSGVHFITAGSRAPNPVDLLGSQEMKKLIARLSSIYDFVVLDSPPLLPVSDGLLLVRSVDKVVFLTRWSKTKRETALTGLKQLVEAGADLAGIVLSQVDVRKHAMYDYGDSGYYSPSYKNYYIE